jgi:hypothetical protein
VGFLFCSSSGQKPQPHCSRPISRWFLFAGTRHGKTKGTPLLTQSTALALMISSRFRCVAAADIVRFSHEPLRNVTHCLTFVNRRIAAGGRNCRRTNDTQRQKSHGSMQTPMQPLFQNHAQPQEPRQCPVTVLAPAEQATDGVCVRAEPPHA